MSIVEIISWILEYLKVLIWPIIIGGVIIYYRKNIQAFIDRIWKLKFPGGELEAEKQKNLQSVDEGGGRENAEETLSQQTELIEEVKNQYETQYSTLQQNAQQAIQDLLNQLSVKDIQLNFERTYNVIFGSQIALLELLLPKTTGESRAFLDLFYSQVKKINFPIFENWTLDAYIQLLIYKLLVEVTPVGNYKITVRGASFLSYITNLNYPKNKDL